MNNLTELYSKIKSFADDHNMVNEFFVANTEDDLNNREFNFKNSCASTYLKQTSQET